MNAKEDPVRELIAQEAANWFVANREALEAAAQRATFAAWLRTSPVHVEEYLSVALIALDLRDACDDPNLSLDDLLTRARAADEPTITVIKPHGTGVQRRWLWLPRPWLSAASALAALAVLSLGFLFWKDRLSAPAPVSPGTEDLVYIRTRHGEQLNRWLPDRSVLHLNTDTDVMVLYKPKERVVFVEAGQVEIEVAHDPARKFLVLARSVEITAVGTKFDVYVQRDSTVITVLEGRVAVSDTSKRVAGIGSESNQTPQSKPVAVSAGQQIRVTEGVWPPTSSAVDAQRATAWLRRQIVFEHEPLAVVATEFNRYTKTPVEIETPALRSLEVSGVFTADDTESFVAFLRSLDGVQVEVTDTRIQVSRK
jgi:transmembrane sensor